MARQPEIPNRVFGYVRVSTDEQAESGLSLASQRAQIVDHCVRMWPGTAISEIFADEGVSARRVPFLLRSSGARLDASAQRGDAIVIAKLDRAFRSLRDCATMLERWSGRGVVIHMLDIGVATETPLGQLVVGIMASVAQWESSRISERIREAFAAARAQGRTPNGQPLIGYRLEGAGSLVPDNQMRRVVTGIVWLRDHRRLLYRQIAAILNRRRLRTVKERPWSVSSVWHAYHLRETAGWPEWRIDVDDSDVQSAAASGYRHATGERKRLARLKVSAERRREIAQMGARARHAKRADPMTGKHSLDVLGQTPSDPCHP